MTDYEKLYNDAVKKMLDIIRGDEHPVLPKEIGLHLFPELKEQLQNEMFQRMAIKAIRTEEGQNIIKQNGVNPEDVIVWLNQEHAVTENKNKKLMYSVGDWLIKMATNYNYPAYPVLVTDIKDGYYIFDNNNDTKCEINNINTYKKWTLFDAKDGDILVYDNCGDLNIFIYKCIKLHESFTDFTITYYCIYNVQSDTLEYKQNTFTLNDIHKITPATVKQENMLHNKLFENYLKWDRGLNMLKIYEKPCKDQSIINSIKNKPLSELSDEGYKMVADYVMNADENKIVDVIKRCIRQTLYEGKEKTDALEWVTTHMTHSTVPQWVLDDINACRKYICECTYNKNHKEYSTKLLRVQQWIESNHAKNNVTDNNA